METVTTFVSIAETEAQISLKIFDEIVKIIKKKERLLLNKTNEIVSEELYSALIKQPEYQEIDSSGRLAAELGIQNPSSAILNIVNSIINSIKVSISYSNFPNVFKISILASPDDYSDLYALGDSSYITNKGEIIEWLKWLLEAGDGVIVVGYDVNFGSYGRTGEAHMIPGNGWSVPSQFAGIKGNNFITRAIEIAAPKIEKRIEEIINVI